MPNNDVFTEDPPEAQDLYHRQEELGVRKPTVMLVGCGGVGTWVGMFLAMGGSPRLELYDGDDLTLTNLNRVPYPMGDLNKNKAEALKDLVAKLRPECDVTARPHFLPVVHGQNVQGVEWVIAATDNLESRRVLHELCEKYGTAYLECGAESLQASMTTSPPEWSTEKEGQAGYEVVPSFVGPCVMAAALAASTAMLSNKYNKTEVSYQVAWDRDGQQFQIKKWEGA